MIITRVSRPARILALQNMHRAVESDAHEAFRIEEGNKLLDKALNEEAN
jgi:hypothetical protein